MFEEGVFDCPKRKDGCESSYNSFNLLLQHVQNECLYFGSKYYPLLPKTIKNPEAYPTPNITKFILNNEEPIEEELPDSYLFLSTQPQRNRILKKSDKQIRAGPQRFIKDKDVPNTDSLEISKCMLKSSIFVVFRTGNKKIKYLTAFPSDNYDIIVRDFVDLNVQPVVLKGHKDIITELRNFKLGNDDYLFSCSYDTTCKAWKCHNWELSFTLNFGNWVTSCTILNDKFKTGNYYIALCGGFNPNYPIKIYNFSAEQISEIKVKDSSTAIGICHYHDEVNQKTFFFISSDSDKGSALHMYDYHLKSLVRSFPSEKYCTKVEFYIDNSNNLIITYVDFKGILKQYNVNNGKLIKQVNLGTNCFDLISFDEEYFICCGDHNDNSFKVIYKDGLQVVKTYPQSHNNVILNLGFLEHPQYGKILLTMGADKKISIFKK